MEKLRVPDKNITLSTFEKIVKMRAKEFSCTDTDVLALQFMHDCRSIKNCTQPVIDEFFDKFGNSGELNQAKAAKNFVHWCLFGEKLYN